jgi:hypothetical protein
MSNKTFEEIIERFKKRPHEFQNNTKQIPAGNMSELIQNYPFGNKWARFEFIS